MKPVNLARAWLLVLAVVSGFASAQNSALFSDFQEETTFVEEGIGTPPAFSTEDVIAFTPARAGSAKWGVDPQTIRIGKDRVVRYVVIAQSQSGVVNAFYEGIRCGTVENKVYARYSGGTWTKARQAQWRSMFDIPGSRHALTLAHLGFCEGKTAPFFEKAIVRHLQAGGRDRENSKQR